MLYSFRVEFETDSETGDIVVSLPSLNHTADSGEHVEEALENLQELAVGFIEMLRERGDKIPESDPPGEGTFLFLEVDSPASVQV